MLRDILKGADPQIDAVVQTIAQASPDILVIQGFDYDMGGAALSAFADLLAQGGVNYPIQFALPPNAGLQTTLDMDGDGKTGGPRDAQGYGRFFGDGAMAILSRYPVLTSQVHDYSDLLWRDLPGAILPTKDGDPFPSFAAQQEQRLSSHGHWVVPIETPTLGTVTLMTSHATPPVFDGPEDRNGLRNQDEILFWDHFLGGVFAAPPSEKFVLLGDMNNDPDKGEGLKPAIHRLLDHPQLQDPLIGQPTAIFNGLGDMRVDYLLPSNDWRVIASGIARNPTASRHSLIWVDLER
ncbi:endonuclease/exonuclease/phosphatase family protein [Sulfitobacter sp. CW3]|uniref:endonuclease/exonuclease/phosphatase family protein n=1 Tax=Sulfitobacter sp. CW3 TaxID=2861965 RepID=UPI001C5CE0B6|nr:endonuclease/exonuclease/phosphatase family protein [Sulfitobacter sp. CW3]MBW4961536.1 endonuclease/exonuclease/phosphatase family protein [Sulfitobacter sp. CW3]